MGKTIDNLMTEGASRSPSAAFGGGFPGSKVHHPFIGSLLNIAAKTEDMNILGDVGVSKGTPCFRGICESLGRFCQNRFAEHGPDDS